MTQQHATEPKVDYDHFSPEVARNPFPIWENLRENAPCAWSEAHGGFHVITRHADVRNVETDWESFSSAQGISLPPAPFPPALPIEVDPPIQTLYRNILNPLLSPKAIALFEDTTRAFARELISGLPKEGAFDLAPAFTDPFPKRTSIRWIGFPDEDYAQLNHIVETLATVRGTVDADMAALAELGMEMMTYFGAAVSNARSAPPADHLLAALVRSDIEGRPLRDDEIILTLTTVLFGALHTTTMTLTGMALWLIDNPEQREALLADPTMTQTAVEEFLRFLSPSSGVVRTVTKDVEVAGCPMHAGEKVMVVNGSANHDPREFPNPEIVDLRRHPNRHMTFGAGPHRCVGAHLAKLMIRVALEELGPILKELQVPDRTALRYAGGEGRGVLSLPVIRGASR